jgi:hypothetical protein
MNAMNQLLGALVAFTISSIASAQTLLNPSFEDWANPTICETNLAPDNWLNFSNAGLAPDEGNYPLCPSTIPGHAAHGNVYARFMSGTPIAGEGMRQIVSGFSPGKQYMLTFDFAGSNLWGGNDELRFKIYLNNVLVDSTIIFSSLDTLWQKHVLVFNALTSTIDIGFRGHTPAWPSSGGSAAMDNVTLQPFTTTGLGASFVQDVFRVYPNPCSSYLNVDVAFAENVQLQLIDMTGKVQKIVDFSGYLSLDVSPLSAGCYTLLLLKDGQLLSRELFMKREQ